MHLKKLETFREEKLRLCKDGVLAGARRSITCMALDEGAVLVQLSRKVFVSFIAENPKALQIYLEQGVSRLWRVANFILSDYLALDLPASHSTTATVPPANVEAWGKDSNDWRGLPDGGANYEVGGATGSSASLMTRPLGGAQSRMHVQMTAIAPTRQSSMPSGAGQGHRRRHSLGPSVSPTQVPPVSSSLAAPAWAAALSCPPVLESSSSTITAPHGVDAKAKERCSAPAEVSGGGMQSSGTGNMLFKSTSVSTAGEPTLGKCLPNTEVTALPVLHVSPPVRARVRTSARKRAGTRAHARASPNRDAGHAPPRSPVKDSPIRDLSCLEDLHEGASAAATAALLAINSSSSVLVPGAAAPSSAMLDADDSAAGDSAMNVPPDLAGSLTAPAEDDMRDIAEPLRAPGVNAPVRDSSPVREDGGSGNTSGTGSVSLVDRVSRVEVPLETLEAPPGCNFPLGPCYRDDCAPSHASHSLTACADEETVALLQGKLLESSSGEGGASPVVDVLQLPGQGQFQGDESANLLSVDVRVPMHAACPSQCMQGLRT
jgi:hypothetical protein